MNEAKVLYASTDMSRFNDQILLGYVLSDENENVVESKCYHSKTIEEGLAEDLAVMLLIRDFKDTGVLQNLHIKCDNSSSVNRLMGSCTGKLVKRYRKLFNFAQGEINRNGITIEHVKREQNKLAHTLCEFNRMALTGGFRTLKDLEIETIKLSDFSSLCKKNLKHNLKFNMKKERNIRFSHCKSYGAISSSTLNKKQEKHLLYEYSKRVKASRMKSLEYLYLWGSIQKSKNTVDGRTFFIKRFVENQHLKDDLLVKN